MKQVSCPNCSATGTFAAMIGHHCDEIRQEPRAAEGWREPTTNDICRRIAIHHAITADLDDVDLELRLAMSLDWTEPRVYLMTEQIEVVKATVRAGRVPREEVMLLAAQCQHWLEAIDREAGR